MTYDIENFNYNADLYRVEGVGTWEANYQWNFTTGLEIFVTTPSDPHYAWGERFFIITITMVRLGSIMRLSELTCILKIR